MQDKKPHPYSPTHWSHGKTDESYSPRERKEAFEKFVYQQQKRAAIRALRERQAKEAELSDSEKLANARKRREEMHLARIAEERKRRESVYFIGSNADGANADEPEIVELTGHAEIKLR